MGIAILARWHALCADERGASLVEYAFLAMLIAIAALVAVEFLGNEVEGTFTELNNQHP